MFHHTLESSGQQVNDKKNKIEIGKDNYQEPSD